MLFDDVERMEEEMLRGNKESLERERPRMVQQYGADAARVAFALHHESDEIRALAALAFKGLKPAAREAVKAIEQELGPTFSQVDELRESIRERIVHQRW